MSYHNLAVKGLFRSRTFTILTLNHNPQPLLWKQHSSNFLLIKSSSSQQQQQQQCRGIFSYLTNLFRSNTIIDQVETNPILDYLRRQQEQETTTDYDHHSNTGRDATPESVMTTTTGSTVVPTTAPGTTTISETIELLRDSATTTGSSSSSSSIIDPSTFPKFSIMKPSHVLDAYEYVQQEQLQLLQQAVDDIQNYTVVVASATGSSTSSGSNPDVHNGMLLSKLDTIIRWIDTIQQSLYTLRQITSFMCTIANHTTKLVESSHPKQNQKSEWYNAIQPLQSTTTTTTTTSLTDNDDDDDGSRKSVTAHVSFPIIVGTTTTTTSAVTANDTARPAMAALQWKKLHVELYKVTHSINEQMQQSLSSNIVLSQHDQSNLYASQYIIRNYIHETGDDVKQWSSDDNKNNNNNNNNNTVEHLPHEKYNELSEMMNDVRLNILDIESTSVSLSSVKLIYTYLGIRTEQAKLLGYNTIADQTFGNKNSNSSFNYFQPITTSIAADIDTVRQLHVHMTQRLLPILRQITDKSRRTNQPKLALESYLSSTKNNSGQDATRRMKNQNQNAANSKYSIQQYRSDVLSMIRLEQHVTFAGALEFSFRLIQDLFGISIIESNADHDDNADNETKWDSSVRLFHCYDTLNQNKYIGSIYIDPFQRKEKMSRPATIPIVARTKTQAPIVCISLTLEVPIWDTNPAMMTWNDCEGLLHELGHALQFVMAESNYGCVLGAQAMPLDISELLPKFMELWMTQRSSLYALIDMSKSISPLSDEEIDAAYRVKAREKVLKLAELTYYGTLEMELLSNFDIRGSETILALQQRIAEKIIPHIDYDKDDMTALLDIVEENVHGRQVAWYRYLLCEVHAAAIFENLLHVMSTEPEAVTQLRMYLRQYLLQPGANIDYAMFRSKLRLSDVKVDPLWKLHMLVDSDEATK